MSQYYESSNIIHCQLRVAKVKAVLSKKTVTSEGGVIAHLPYKYSKSEGGQNNFKKSFVSKLVKVTSEFV